MDNLTVNNTQSTSESFTALYNQNYAISEGEASDNINTIDLQTDKREESQMPYTTAEKDIAQVLKSIGNSFDKLDSFFGQLKEIMKDFSCSTNYSNNSQNELSNITSSSGFHKLEALINQLQKIDNDIKKVDEIKKQAAEERAYVNKKYGHWYDFGLNTLMDVGITLKESAELMVVESVYLKDVLTMNKIDPSLTGSLFSLKNNELANPTQILSQGIEQTRMAISGLKQGAAAEVINNSSLFGHQANSLIRQRDEVVQKLEMLLKNFQQLNKEINKE